MRSIFSAFILAFFLLVPTCVWADVILSEIQVEGEKAADEFVELSNSSDEAKNLSGWSIRRKSVNDVTAKGSSLKTFGSTDMIPPHGYFLWANSGSIFKDLADVTTSSSLSDNNSLALYDKTGTLVDSLTWGSGHALPFSPPQFGNPDKKESFTRDLQTLVWTKTKRTTPINSRGESLPVEEEPPVPIDPGLHILLINEVFPNPKEKDDAGEFIELFNPGVEGVDLSDWEIHDASTSGKYTFPNGALIPSRGYLVITDQEFSFSLNNTHETLSLFDRAKRLVHQVSYEKTKEGVSLNLVGNALRGARKPTPGALNSENTNPMTRERVPKKGYRDFAIEFHARGKDSDGDSLKFTWDFGDDHKSYKEDTTHKFEKTGRYTITLVTDDGIDTTQETFEIKIEKYKAPKLRIVAFVPNPAGKDSDLEWIEIENREKKSVNLNGFSIATGTKKKSMSNHPINKDFQIPGKSTRRLTRAASLFTLGNVRGHLELRAPNGEVVHELKYKFDKALGDDTVLKKEKGKALAPMTSPVETEESQEPELKEASPIPSSIEVGVTSSSALIEKTTEVPVVQDSSEALPTEITPIPDEVFSSQGEGSSQTNTLITSFHFPGIQFLSQLFKSEQAENKNTLARWESALNLFLNEWLSDTAVATKREEGSE